MSETDLRRILEAIAEEDASHLDRTLAELALAGRRRDRRLESRLDRLRSDHDEMRTMVEEIKDHQRPLVDAYGAWADWKGYILTGAGILATAVLAAGGQAVAELIFP